MHLSCRLGSLSIFGENGEGRELGRLLAKCAKFDSQVFSCHLPMLLQFIRSMQFEIFVNVIITCTICHCIGTSIPT